MGGGVRLARKEDKGQMLDVISSYPFKWDKKIAKSYYDDYFAGSMSLKEDRVFVYSAGDQIKGVVGYSIDRYETGNCGVGWLYVDKKDSAHGIGGRLLSYIEKRLRKKNVRWLYVSTSSTKNYKPGLKFYRDHGFLFEARLESYYEDGEDQIILCKRLASTHG